MSPVGTNSSLLRAFVRLNEWGQAEMGCSEPGRDCAKACLSSHICHSAAGLELEGSGTDWGVEALAKAPWAGGHLDQPAWV